MTLYVAIFVTLCYVMYACVLGLLVFTDMYLSEREEVKINAAEKVGVQA